MAVSAITITDLQATTGLVGSIVASWKHEAPEGQGCLPYMQPASFDVYVSATNDFGAATLYKNVLAGPVTISGLAASVTRYIWVRAIDPAGNEGEFAGPVNATTSNQVPPTNSVGSNQIQDDAIETRHYAALSIDTAAIKLLAVENGNIKDLSVTKLLAGEITATITITGPLIRTAASGTRIEMSTSSNGFLVYQGGSLVARFGTPGSSVILDIASGGASIGGGLLVGGASGVAACTVIQSFSGGSDHAMRGQRSGSSGIVGSATGHAFYAETGTYGPFTASHDAMLLIGEELEEGDIVVSELLLGANGINDTLLKVSLAARRADPAVFGVVSARAPVDAETLLAAMQGKGEYNWRAQFARLYHRLTANSGGEGMMNVCGRGGNLSAGDLIISSDMPGKGERLDPETIMTAGLYAAIAAKATAPIIFDHPDHVRLCPVTYRAG